MNDQNKDELWTIYRVDENKPSPVKTQCTKAAYRDGTHDADGKAIYSNVHFWNKTEAWEKILRECEIRWKWDVEELVKAENSVISAHKKIGESSKMLLEAKALFEKDTNKIVNVSDGDSVSNGGIYLCETCADKDCPSTNVVECDYYEKHKDPEPPSPKIYLPSHFEDGTFDGVNGSESIIPLGTVVYISDILDKKTSVVMPVQNIKDDNPAGFASDDMPPDRKTRKRIKARSPFFQQ